MCTFNELTRDYQGYDPVTGTYHTRHDWESDESLCETVIFTVAAVTGKPPTEIEPLYDTIDPDALATLFSPISDANPRADGFVSFTLDDQPVMVHASGEIVLDVSDDNVQSEALPRRRLLAATVGATFGVQRLTIERGWQTIGRTLSLQRAAINRGQRMIGRTLSLQRNLLGWY